MRSIIVEGCDGSGKDTLIAKLIRTYPDHTLHARASTSLGGPVASLAEWVAQDAPEMAVSGPWIYNRHPLISEPIYAPIRKTRTAPRGLTGVWSNPEWVAAYQRVVAPQAVLVICDPPFPYVEGTVNGQGRHAHMPGVFDNLFRIWSAYDALVWPGRSIRYDYTRQPYNDLVTTLDHLLEN